MGVAKKIVESLSWSKNELKTVTIGKDVGIKGLINFGGALGYAADEKGNVYAVTLVSGSGSIDASKLTSSQVIKALSSFSASASSQTRSGDYDASELRDFYSGLGFSFTQTNLGIDVSVSVGENGASGGYGGSNSLGGTSVAFANLRYIGNINNL